jgi:hypothetical protein
MILLKCLLVAKLRMIGSAGHTVRMGGTVLLGILYDLASA